MRPISPAALILALSASLMAQTPDNSGERRRRQADGAAPAQANRPDPAQMDTDGDGKISSAEWKGRAEVFARLDSNKDGYLTQDEVIRGQRGERGGRGERGERGQRGGRGERGQRGERGERGERGDSVPRALDTNNDGKIGRDEWKGTAEAFNRLDANQDGFITQDERPRGGRRGDPRGERPDPQ